MVVFFQAPRHKNELPSIGIGFSNNEKPTRAKKLLKSVGTKFILKIACNEVCIKLTGLNDKEIVFEAELNYNEDEFNVFKNVVSNGSKGTLVLGTFINCEFYTVNQKDTAETFNLEKIELIG